MQSQTRARCLSCGSSELVFWAKARDIEYQTVDEEFTYLKCSACQALSIHPVPQDRLAEIYPPTYYSFQESGASILQSLKRWLDRRMFRKIAASVPGRTLAVLDVGGGSGGLLSVFRDAEPRVNVTAVVDIDAQAERQARAVGHEYFLGTIEEFPTDQRFDVILMLNIIEHVADPYAVMKKARGLLTEKGVILVKTPNYDSLDQRIFKNASWGGYHCPRHWTLFTLPGFQALAERAGLSVAKASYTQGAPFWSVSVIGWLKARGVLAKDRRPLYRHPLNGVLMAVFACLDFSRAPFARTSQMLFMLRR